MKKFADYTLMALLAGMLACSNNNEQLVTSPSGEVKLIFSLTADKQPSYRVYFKDSPVIETSTLGFDFKDAPSLSKGM
ncbi:MAG TPA: glycoside hydrolase family 97 N-terminal domain-containing protein, partial [Tenuifilaceae bacterium]|nr:glycoside hydrolase family 97 N-terminal domain-containing protein [Tenuifilaceae bacterium]